MVLLLWYAEDTPNLEGVSSTEDLIVAPFRNDKVTTSYRNGRRDNTAKWGTYGWSNSTGPITDTEPNIDFTIIIKGEAVDPCTVCKYSMRRLGGSCAPLGGNCLNREDKWDEL
jgi:hypothetical protein